MKGLQRFYSKRGYLNSKIRLIKKFDLFEGSLRGMEVTLWLVMVSFSLRSNDGYEDVKKYRIQLNQPKIHLTLQTDC